MQHLIANTFTVSESSRLARTITLTGLVLMILSLASMSWAQKPTQSTFTSAEEASRALFLAVQSDNQKSLIAMLGGGKEIVTTNDELQDKFERGQFAEKYQQMHRLVREPDGSTVLYVGAENWPFPVPLELQGGVWYFDSDSGAQEILFRRVGENEATAIATCHALLGAKKPASATTNAATNNDPISNYVQTIASANEITAGKEDEPGVFHGYYIRKLTKPQKGAGAGDNNSNTGAKPVFVAYPANYRSSGVLTFVVTEDGVVYERDLGPNTPVLARKMTSAPLSSNWRETE